MRFQSFICFFLFVSFLLTLFKTENFTDFSLPCSITLFPFLFSSSGVLATAAVSRYVRPPIVGLSNGFIMRVDDYKKPATTFPLLSAQSCEALHKEWRENNGQRRSPLAHVTTDQTTNFMDITKTIRLVGRRKVFHSSSDIYLLDVQCTEENVPSAGTDTKNSTVTIMKSTSSSSSSSPSS